MPKLVYAVFWDTVGKIYQTVSFLKTTYKTAKNYQMATIFSALLGDKKLLKRRRHDPPATPTYPENSFYQRLAAPSVCKLNSSNE